LQGGAGNDLLDGGTGTDTAVLTGNFADYKVEIFEEGHLVTDNISNRDGITTLNGIETLQFADQTLSVNAALTTPDYVTGVLYDDANFRWNADTSIGDGVSLTYSFMDNTPSYYGSDITSFSIFSTAQENAAKAVLDQFAEISNLSFTEVADTGDGGQLRFGGSFQTGSAGFAFAPSVDRVESGTTYLASPKSGDVFIANNATSNLTLTDGSHGFYTMIHEIGHATGLTHTFEGDNTLDAATENNQYSVMSYTPHPKSTVVDVTGDSSSYTTTTYNWNPESPMVYDIATLQYLYGANTTTRTGDDTYTFDPTKRFIDAIWDGDGTDTLDASNFARASTIDLTPGNYSSIGVYEPISDQLPSWYGGAAQPTYSGEDNVGIAFGTLIENATGGSGNDTLIGNYQNNVLTGGSGDDTLTGGTGDDTLVGDGDNDTYVLSLGSGSDTINDSSGTDDKISGLTIQNLSNAVQNGNDLILSFTSGDRVTIQNHFTSGNEVEIFVSGSDNFGFVGQTSGVVGQIITDPATTGNPLACGAGNDYLFGNEGADTLQGGAGNDALMGGAGNDIFYFATGDGNDVIKDFSHGFDTMQIDGSAFGISTLSFETLTVAYDGTNATNTSSNVIRDGNNDVYVDTNGQAAGGYSLVANVDNNVALDENDIALV